MLHAVENETFTVAGAEPKRCPGRYRAGASLRLCHQPPYRRFADANRQVRAGASLRLCHQPPLSHGKMFYCRPHAGDVVPDARAEAGGHPSDSIRGISHRAAEDAPAASDGPTRSRESLRRAPREEWNCERERRYTRKPSVRRESCTPGAPAVRAAEVADDNWDHERRVRIRLEAVERPLRNRRNSPVRRANRHRKPRSP